MKKLNLGNINAGLSTIKELANENAGIARDELIDVSLIDFANKNTYAANDTDDSIRDLADQIETVGLLNPLGVIQSGNRYKLFSGERRCTSSKLILQNGAMQTIAAYTYNEADTMIRKLYRDGELCPERQDAK